MKYKGKEIYVKECEMFCIAPKINKNLPFCEDCDLITKCKSKKQKQKPESSYGFDNEFICEDFMTF